jgi:hypothetical protein
MRAIAQPIFWTAMLLFAAPAQAVPVTWLSGTGTDAGTCPITAPCRTLAYAVSKTNDRGSVNIISSGNFGPVTITRSIDIVADGVEALINTAANGAGIVVQGTTPVSLHGLTIDLRSDHTGIRLTGSTRLNLHNCVLRNSAVGIHVEQGYLDMSDTVISRTQSGVILGAGIFNRIRIENSNQGIVIDRGTVIISNSNISGNTGQGIVADTDGSQTARVIIDRSAIVNNGTGVEVVGAGGTVWIGDSVVTGNAVGLLNNGGTLSSYVSNKVHGNSANDTVGTITTVDYK